MCHIESKDSLECFPEKSAYYGSNECCLGVDFYLRDEFIDGKEYEKSQGEGDQVLQEKIVRDGEDSRIDMIGYKGAFLDCAVCGRPDGGYG